MRQPWCASLVAERPPCASKKKKVASTRHLLFACRMFVRLSVRGGMGREAGQLPPVGGHTKWLTQVSRSPGSRSTTGISIIV